MRLPAGDSELVQIVDASLADAARLSGEWLVCRLGCTQCCYGAFAINALDVLRLRAGMEALKSAEPDRSAGILRRAQAWIAEYSPGFPATLKRGCWAIPSKSNLTISPMKPPVRRSTRLPGAAMCTHGGR